MDEITFESLSRWLLRGHQEAASLDRCVKKDRQNWWPGDGPPVVDSRRGSEGWFSTWLLGMTVTAAADLTPCLKNTTYLNKSGTHLPQKDNQTKLIHKLWTGSASNRIWKPTDILVDATVTCWEERQPILFAAEMEAKTREPVDDCAAIWGTEQDEKKLRGRYSWDFLKLLLLHSPYRLFSAFIEGSRGSSVAERCSELLQTLNVIYDRSSLVAESEQLGIVLVPGRRNEWREQSILVVVKDGRWDVRKGLSS